MEVGKGAPTSHVVMLYFAQIAFGMVANKRTCLHCPIFLHLFLYTKFYTHLFLHTKCFEAIMAVAMMTTYVGLLVRDDFVNKCGILYDLITHLRYLTHGYGLCELHVDVIIKCFPIS